MAEQKKFLDGNGVKKVKEDYEKKIAVKVDPSALEEYLKIENIDTQLEGYVKDDELTGYLQTETADSTYVKNAEFDSKVKTAVGTVYHPKGSLENLEAIKAVESPAEGDVYNATDTGANYVYIGGEDGVDGTGWDKLSETIDLSGYVTTSSLTDYAKKGDLDAKANTTDLAIALTEEEIEAILNPPVI